MTTMNDILQAEANGDCDKCSVGVSNICISRDCDKNKVSEWEEKAYCGVFVKCQPILEKEKILMYISSYLQEG